jgi:serine/threonine-protein kinase
MDRRSRPAASALWIVAILCLVAGCQGAEGQLIHRWELRAGHGVRPVVIPVHVNDDLPKEIGRYKLTATVVVDERLRGRELDLVIPSLPAQVVLRVNGTEVPPAETRTEEYRHVGPHRWTLPQQSTADGTLALELDVLHNWTQSAWLDVAPCLIPAGAETAVLQRNRVFNDRGGWFGLVGLSQLGVTFLAVYLWDRSRRAYLWFAIQALSASYYPAYTLGIVTWLGPHLEILLLAQSLSVASTISVYYTHALFELGRPHRLWIVLLLVAALTPTPALFSAFLDPSYATPGVVACVGATVLYQLVTGVRLLSRYPDRRIVVFFLCCWIALGGSAWVDMMAWLGATEVLDGARPACIGLGLFGIFQSMLLSRSHFRSLRESDDLNASLRNRLRDLEERQAEIQSLNEELRQQVGRRSGHILAALAGASASGASLGFEPGDVIEDRYRIIGALGAGGMGTVYEVERLHDRRRLALKVALETQGLALARLAREAQLATRVRHPNVVSVVDTDVAKDGFVYLVMELVEGCSLAEREDGSDVRWCLKVLVQILEGLGALHAQEIIHRDLKPENVLLSGDIDRDPQVKITDFGISRAFSEPPAPPAVRRPSSLEPATVLMGT